MKTLFLLFPLFAYSQIGVNTTSPDAGIDLNLPNTGIKLPEVLLRNKIDNSTVKSNNNGTTKKGTLVFNVNNTTGFTGISTGMYYFNGVRWEGLYNKEQYESRKQLVTKFSNNYGNFFNIPELNIVHVPDYTGLYKITLTYLVSSEPLPADSSSNTPSIGRGKMEILNGNTVIASQTVESYSFKDKLIYKKFTMSVEVNLNAEQFNQFYARFTPLEKINNCYTMYVKDGLFEIEYKQERFN